MFTKSALAYEALPLPARDAMSDAQMRHAADLFLAAMQTRHTVRDFSPRPVPVSYTHLTLPTIYSV